MSGVRVLLWPERKKCRRCGKWLVEKDQGGVIVAGLFCSRWCATLEVTPPTTTTPRQCRKKGRWKVKYPTAAEADVSADKVMVLNGESKRMQVYTCPRCGWWHMGNYDPAKAKPTTYTQPSWVEATLTGNTYSGFASEWALVKESRS